MIMKEEDLQDNIQKIVLTGINIPFLELVGFLVKLAIAAVPAGIIVAVFWGIIVSLFGSFFFSGMMVH